MEQIQKMQLLVFGDQTAGFNASLRRLINIKHKSLLTSFLQRSHFALKHAIGRLPEEQRSDFPNTASLPDLLADYALSVPHPALESAFHSMNQLGSFIAAYEDGDRPYPSSSDVRTAGVCTGVLAAVAVSFAQSVESLVPLAVETVLVSFRTGMRAHEIRSRVLKGETEPCSWLVMASQATVEKAIAQFCQDQHIPTTISPYISAISPSCITLSGRPSIVRQCLETTELSKCKPMKLPIYAPYHTGQLYCDADVANILSAAEQEILERRSSSLPLLFPQEISDLGSALRFALRQILIEPVQLNNLSRSLADAAKRVDCSKVTIVPVAATALQGVATAVAKCGVSSVDVATDIAELSRKIEQATATGNPGHSKLAIVGFGGRFPEADSLDEFWQLLQDGRDVHKPIPADRFDAEAHWDPTGKRRNTSKVKHGCFIRQPGLFDEKFFNMSPREAANSDPAQRLAITTAYEAMEMAGMVPDATNSTRRDRVGIFYGMTSDDWREVNSGQNVDTYFIPGGNRAFTPGRLNYHFKFCGPSFSIDTACSSSLAAINAACNTLWKGDCDTAIAGGVNIITNPDNFAGLDRGHFLSTTGNCNTFDDAANGYCRADAIGTIILKRLEDAEADRDPIHGIILSASTNHSAEAESMTRPHTGAQVSMLNHMLNSAGLESRDVSYVEMHGTGTQAGDATEMRTMLQVFAQDQKQRGDRPIHVGSVKSNVGHSESASGVTALIKVLLMMKASAIPPHCGIKTKINHNFPTDLAQRNLHIAFKTTPWERHADGRPRVAFVNNFSAAGGNSSVLLQDGPVRGAIPTEDARLSQVITISGKSKNALQQNLQAMLQWAQSNPNASLPALSYTTTARRIHYNHRVGIAATDLVAVQQGLQKAIEQERKPTKKRKVAFAFTGQGMLKSGMGKIFYDNFSSFRYDVLQYDKVAQDLGFESFTGFLTGEITTDTMELSPVVTQLGHAAFQMALTKLWKAWGVEPVAVIGHSLGEYAALHASGVLSPNEVIFLVGSRATLLKEKCTPKTHAMLSVRESVSTLKSKFGSNLPEVACINGPSDTVLSGPNEVVASVLEALMASRTKHTGLNVPYAFHSSQVEPVLSNFHLKCQGVQFADPTVPYISPLLKQVINEGSRLGHGYLADACRGTVDFNGAITTALEAGVVDKATIWVEVGPHPVCSTMLKNILGSETVAVPSTSIKQEPWSVLATSLASLYTAGVDIKWSAYCFDFKESAHVIELPKYAWDAKNHWIQYKNNFTLDKGETPPVQPLPQLQMQPVQILTNFKTTASAQKVIQESENFIEVESDISTPALTGVVQNHKVNGIMLCPSSLYADIGLTLANYLAEEAKQLAPTIGLNVAEVKVMRPLVATGAKQLYRATAKLDVLSRQVRVRISSVSEVGKNMGDHCECMIKLEDKEAWSRDWKRSAYLVKARINTLHTSESDNVEIVKRNVAYKLFSALVDYGKPYQGMEQVAFDSLEHESSARVRFQAEPAEDFFFSPYCIDSLGHLAGFTMNADMTNDSSKQVFINHGWDAMQVSKKLSAAATYHTYVRMAHLGNKLYSGDVYIMEDDEIVAVYTGVKFQGVPRQVLDGLDPSKARAPAKATAPKAAAVAPKVPTIMERRQSIKPAEIPIAQLSQPSKSIAALAIIAKEVGVDVTEMKPELAFEDVGLDSLLSLTVAECLREELGLEVDSSLFITCATVKDLVAHLDKLTGSAPVPPSSSVKSSCSSVSMSRSVSSWSASSWSDVGSGTPSTAQTSVAPTAAPSECGDKPEQATTTANDSAIEGIRQVIAEEIGVELGDITGPTDFNELGLDSLLALNLTSRLREYLDTDIPSTLFTDCSTFNEVLATLGIQTAVAKPSAPEVPREPARVLPPASSVLLQGSAATCTQKLFLFPDGSGSASSYIGLPQISKDVAVYGLNCPFQKSPAELEKIRLDELTAPYIAEIRRRQPQGPYSLGGWSAGGICAYDAAQKLIAAGEKVERLLLLDSPFPIGLGKLPPRLYQFLNGLNLFGEGTRPPPSWLLPHFLAFIESLDTYRAVPFAPGTAPKTFAIWAADGVCKDKPMPELLATDPKEMKWILSNRSDFGPNGWDGLLPGAKFATKKMENANHFTMMKNDKAAELSAFIGEAMSS
ncbi:polyketide synthase [Lecanosticta acicola]|uniref:Polyketide synthase n=1 Tax=Lecanosticta acicola TaxID=111012 RepID=A0AAI8YXT7_9PEZI|nr:polyketide synthase [Lecanosticta acicola]